MTVRTAEVTAGCREWRQRNPLGDVLGISVNLLLLPMIFSAATFLAPAEWDAEKPVSLPSDHP